MTNEEVGTDAVTDYLLVSSSSADYVGHLFGPSSLEMEDDLLWLNRTISKLLALVEKKVGLVNVHDLSLALQEALRRRSADTVAGIHVGEAAERYIVDLVIGTREPQRHGEDLARWIRLGASPRGTLALDAAARAHAWLQGQDFVSPENIRAVAPACLAHRIHLSYEAEAVGKTRSEVVEALLETVASV